MTIYKNATIPVRKEIESLHETQMRSLAASGTWWSGPERKYFAMETRSAILGQNRSLRLPETSERSSAILEAAKKVVSEVASSGRNISRHTLDNALESGIKEGEYVEVIGVVTRTVCLDIFCTGLGIPCLPLPTPTNEVPPKSNPTCLADEGAWLKTIPSGTKGGTDSSNLYGQIAAPFIFRALSMVPDEARQVMDLTNTQYVPPEELMNFTFSHEDTFGRPEIELVAGRTSVINECFY